MIVEVNRTPVTSVETLRTALDKHPAGTPVLVLVQREGQNLYLTVGA